MSTLPPTASGSRLYALDWLRVIAFGLLILYHIGMFFVPSDWHLKTAAPVEALEYPMSLLNAWRLGLLFFISGVAMRFLLDKQGADQFAGSRTYRLLPVILFGMIVIVAPQTYFELRQADAIGADYLAFWARYLSEVEINGITVPTWNHLWYVVYLFVYALLLAAFARPLTSLGNSRVGRGFERAWQGLGGAVLLLILPAMPFILFRFALDPYFETTHNLIWDWATHARSITIFLIGFYAAKSAAFWRAVQGTWIAAGLLSVVYAGLLAVVWRVDASVWEDGAWFVWPIRLLRIFYGWWAIVFLLGAAQRFLSSDGPRLRYLNEAVFPLYIFHQTLTVAAGYWVSTQTLPLVFEFGVLLVVTVGGSLIGVELAKRTGPLRLLFGLKPSRRSPEALSA
ncbi:MAG: acyltransferase family protein [Pseudomonadota bacterium]